MNRLLASAIVLTAATAGGIAADARPLTAEQEARIQPSGPPVRCIQIRSIASSRVRDDRTIDFYMAGRRVYRNRLPQSCHGLGFEGRFGYSTSQAQLCSVDIITVLRVPPDIGGPSCQLGAFQPITGAPR